ncbi:uncharacterized protein G2W53_020047 [Senna tora]|uniref:Uncharacterized protein n=1 Tax=Senna tora TaxID=362788 RepID=A0A834TUP6_9FABA|nr:uncharacterized protein G2W53_020047 [Senna tora]
MFRSLTSRRGSHGIGSYERLGKEFSAVSPLIPEEFQRSTSLPAVSALKNLPRSKTTHFGGISNLQRQATKKGNNNNNNNSNFMDFRRKRKSKTTARPEFARYIEYVKEGGMWDFNSNKPVMHYN